MSFVQVKLLSLFSFFGGISAASVHLARCFSSANRVCLLQYIIRMDMQYYKIGNDC